VRLLVVALALVSCTSILGLEDVDTLDRDNDGVVDDLDNCVDAANPDQSDFDANGMGDACDLCTDGGEADIDGDGIPDGCDGCVGIGADSDGDGIDDGCDPCQNTNRDVDADGIDDGCDACIGNTDVEVDVDKDGIDDKCDPCVSTVTADADGDLIQDGCDPCVCISVPGCSTPLPHDEDRDMVDDGCDNCVTVSNPAQGDVDMDDVGGACDPDNQQPQREIVDTFATASNAWFIQGVWSVANDVATGTGNAIAAAARYLTTRMKTMSFRVATRVEPVTLGIGAKVMIDLIDTLPPPGTQRIWCQAAFGTGSLAQVVVQLVETSSGTTRNVGAPASVAIGQGDSIWC
jgi:hypothetical protein